MLLKISTQGDPVHNNKELCLKTILKIIFLIIDFNGPRFVFGFGVSDQTKNLIFLYTNKKRINQNDGC